MKDLQKLAALSLAALRDNGADRAACLVSETVTQEFTAETEGLNLLRTLFDDSASLTGYAGGRKGSSSVNRLEDSALRSAAETAMASAAASLPDDAWELAQEGGGVLTYGAVECDLERLFLRTQELIDAVHAQHPTVTVSQVIALHSVSHTVYVNSYGVVYQITSGCYEFSLEVSGHEGDKTSSLNYSGILVNDLDRPVLEQGSMLQTVRDAEALIDPPALTGKQVGTVVLSPGFLGEMLSEAAELFTGDDGMINDTALWKDRLGQQVADPAITFGSCPLDSRIVGGDRVTDEGYPAEDYTIVDHGVLKQMTLSRYGANKTGLPPAGNSELHLVMEPGDKPLADIIRNIDYGILAGYFSGGQPGSSGGLLRRGEEQLPHRPRGIEAHLRGDGQRQPGRNAESCGGDFPGNPVRRGQRPALGGL
ncbi:MAG: metallopeptidase TldD-related protein [Clostridiales bacterium]|nr:metallopeptidase TldD-related protein [Clostridiales bacterium]